VRAHGTHGWYPEVYTQPAAQKAQELLLKPSLLSNASHTTQPVDAANESYPGKHVQSPTRCTGASALTAAWSCPEKRGHTLQCACDVAAAGPAPSVLCSALLLRTMLSQKRHAARPAWSLKELTAHGLHPVAI